MGSFIIDRDPVARARDASHELCIRPGPLCARAPRARGRTGPAGWPAAGGRRPRLLLLLLVVARADVGQSGEQDKWLLARNELASSVLWAGGAKFETRNFRRHFRWRVSPVKPRLPLSLIVPKWRPGPSGAVRTCRRGQATGTSRAPRRQSIRFALDVPV